MMSDTTHTTRTDAAMRAHLIELPQSMPITHRLDVDDAQAHLQYAIHSAYGAADPGQDMTGFITQLQDQLLPYLVFCGDPDDLFDPDADPDVGLASSIKYAAELSIECLPDARNTAGGSPT